MYFQSIACAVVLTAGTLTWGVTVPLGLPDGMWSGYQLPNGTTVTTSLSDPTIPPIIEHHDFVPNNLHERGSGTGACWGYQLDPPSVDRDNEALQEYFGDARQFCANGGTAWTGKLLNNVLVYYCIDTPNDCTYVTAAIIRQGMASMDAICQHYEAGWALDGGLAPDGTRYLMGKCSNSPTVNSYICQ